MKGGGRELNTKELHNLYSQPHFIRMIKSRRMRYAGHAAGTGETKAYNILVAEPEGKRPLGRRRCRWEDSINMDDKGIGWEDVDWIQLAQDREPATEPYSESLETSPDTSYSKST
jgi:hypothetical protein